MSDLEFVFLTEDDRRHTAYGLCVLGMIGTGAMFGSAAGGQTLPGAAIGAVMGLVMCKAVEAPLKRQLFDVRSNMNDYDFLALARQTRTAYPNMNRRQVLDLLAEARIAAWRQPGRYQC